MHLAEQIRPVQSFTFWGITRFRRIVNPARFQTETLPSSHTCTGSINPGPLARLELTCVLTRENCKASSAQGFINTLHLNHSTIRINRR